jgi:hypothetical protein
MFDAYHHHSHHDSVSVSKRVEVHEHRAPTDESLKLLNEMREKTLASIVNAVRLENCAIDGVIHHMRDFGPNCPFGADRFLIRYKLNGRSIDVRHEFERKPLEGYADAAQRLVDELRAALADSISRELLGRAFEASKLRPRDIVL